MRTSAIQPPLGTKINRSHPFYPNTASWLMNEGGGQMFFDGSGKTNIPGQLYNGASFAKSQIGSCIVFDGVDDYAKVTNLNLGATTKLTVSLWIKHTTTAASVVCEQSINYNLNTNSFFLAVNVNTVGDFYFGTNGNSINTQNVVYTTGVSYNTGLWNHLVCVADRQIAGTAQLSIYVNGVKNTTQDAANSRNQTLNFGAYDLYIAARGGTVAPASMSISNFMIYDRALFLQGVRDLFVNPYQMYIGRKR